MSPQEWLDTLRSRGASVTVEGDRLVIEPDVLTDEEAAELAALKPAVLGLLTGRALSSPLSAAPTPPSNRSLAIRTPGSGQSKLIPRSQVRIRYPARW